MIGNSMDIFGWSRRGKYKPNRLGGRSLGAMWRLRQRLCGKCDVDSRQYLGGIVEPSTKVAGAALCLSSPTRRSQPNVGRGRRRLLTNDVRPPRKPFSLGGVGCWVMSPCACPLARGCLAFSTHYLPNARSFWLPCNAFKDF